MPDKYCCFVGCGSCRWHKGIGIFKLPPKSTDQNHQVKLLSDSWRSAWLTEISRYRNVYTCEKHFNPEDIEIRNGSGV